MEINKDTHGGNRQQYAKQAGRPVEDIIDFSANINPLGPPAWLTSVITSQIPDLSHYPSPDCAVMKATLAKTWNIKADEIFIGNGSSELLYTLPLVLDKGSALISVPSYLDYDRAAQAAGLDIKTIALDEALNFKLNLEDLSQQCHGGEIVFIGQPNNPNGLSHNPDGLRRLAADNPDTFFIIDEAFLGFIKGADSLVHNRPANAAVLISFTKLFAMAGLRLGCVVAEAKWITAIQKRLPFWTVNSLAQAVGEKLADSPDYVSKSQDFCNEERAFLTKGLADIKGLHIFPGEANFILLRSDIEAWKAPVLFNVLLNNFSIAIRCCGNYPGLDDRYFRVAVRTHEENKLLLDALTATLQPGSNITPSSKAARTPALMIQGTTSNAGKSILAAAFCRIMLQDGYRVAPFKSQNMSLNSYVTQDHLEMGRAQVVQAQAARLEPSVLMNPVLLKPNSDTGSQVIINGKPVGNMQVKEYRNYLPTAFEAVKTAYDTLAEDCDVMILEGAGSPAEVNLKKK